MNTGTIDGLVESLSAAETNARDVLVDAQTIVLARDLDNGVLFDVRTLERAIENARAVAERIAIALSE